MDKKAITEFHDWRKAREEICDLMENGDGFCGACIKTLGHSSHKENNREYRENIGYIREMFALLYDYVNKYVNGEVFLPDRLKELYPQVGSADWECRMPARQIWDVYRHSGLDMAEREMSGECMPGGEIFSFEDIAFALSSGVTSCTKRHHLYNMLIAKGFDEKEAALFAGSMKCDC